MICPPEERPKSARRWGFSLALAYLLLLVATAPDVGFTRDEGFYFTAAAKYQQWFDVLLENPSRALQSDVIDPYWNYNHEHPALMKTLFGFSKRVLHDRLGVLSAATALRFPGMVCAALCVYIIFIWGSRVFDRSAGCFAALAFALMPRVFFHAHLACFDVPIAAMWLLCTYLYWRSLTSLRYGFYAGLVFALALCVKLNAFFLPLVLGGHYLVLLARYFICKRRLAMATTDAPFPLPYAFGFGLLLAPGIFIGHWPWLWRQTTERISAYLAFHANHVHYNTAWFGENIVQAPTPVALPSVMTALTIPTTTLLLGLIGIVLRFGSTTQIPATTPLPNACFGRNGLDGLLLASIVFPIALISLPSVPVFGGTKHWLPAFPFLALFAGAAATKIAQGIAHQITVSGRFRTAIFSTLALFPLLPSAVQTAASHPFGLASYVPLAGGAPGAAALGMTRQFWGYSTYGVLPWLNQHVEPRGTVDFQDSSIPAVQMYQTEGSLRSDIRIGNVRNARTALIHHELHMIRNESWIWNAFATIIPSHVLTYQGVPMVSIYARPPAPETAKTDRTHEKDN